MITLKHQTMNSTAANDRIKELEDYCSPANEELSLEGLHTKLEQIPSTSLACSHFLHELCLHPNVTLEIVELVLQFGPYAAYFCTNRYHGREVYLNEIEHYEISNVSSARWSQMELMSDRSYPIHVACANPSCPGDVISLLAESNPSALSHFCLLEGGCKRYLSGPLTGLPIHYYFSRSNRVNAETVKILVDFFPACLGELGSNNEGCYHPIHALLENARREVTIDILEYFIEKNPDILKMKDCYFQLPIHYALRNEGVILEVIKFLIESWPDCAIYCDGWRHQFPLQTFLSTRRECNSDYLDVLRLLIDLYPELVRNSLIIRESPIHSAARLQSLDVLRLIVDACPEAVQQRDNELRLAFHYACESGTIESVKYLYELYPECITTIDDKGLSPVHLASARIHDPDLRVLKFLLEIDPEGVSREVKPKGGGLLQHNGYFPLHYASEGQSHFTHFVNIKGSMDAIKYLFDIFPWALFKKTRKQTGYTSFCYITPLQIAERSGYTEAFTFFSRQLEALAKYQKDPFPLHSAINDNCTLGVIKLLCTGCFEGDTSKTETSNNFPLRHVCRKEKGNIEINTDAKWPIMLFLEMYECDDKDNLEYICAIWQLLVANPNVLHGAC
jgi:ankyrin repeat protein